MRCRSEAMSLQAQAKAAQAAPASLARVKTITPTRLFRASLVDIEKNKDNYRSTRRLDQNHGIEEVSKYNDCVESDDDAAPVARPPGLIGHLPDREEPSGASGDDGEDWGDTPETIPVRVETKTSMQEDTVDDGEAVKEDEEEDDVASNRSGDFRENSKVNPDGDGSTVVADIRAERSHSSKTKRRKHSSKDLDRQSSSPSQKKMSLGKKRQSFSGSTGAASSHSQSSSKEAHSLRTKCHFPSTDAECSLQKANVTHDSKASGESDLVVCTHKSFRVTLKTHERGDSDVSMKSLSESSTHVLSEHTEKSPSLEEACKDIVSPVSAEEIIGHEKNAVGNGNNKSCPPISQLNDVKKIIRASTAPDFISLTVDHTESLRPVIPYQMPARSNTTFAKGDSCDSRRYPPVKENYPPSPSLFSSPPPPLIVHGVFQWGSSPVVPQPRPAFLVPSPHTETDKRFQCIQCLDDPPKPSFHGYQLIGDSLLLRFSQQLMNENVISTGGLRCLGYCVSGQRIGELLTRLKSGFYHVGKKVVLMIGTNDLLKNTPADQMCTELRRVVELLRSSVEKLILLTLPPVPRLANSTTHWPKLNKYNNFIKELGHKDSGISVHDITPHYILTQEELEEERILAEFKAESPFCHGCLTCLEEDVEWNLAESDEDENGDTELLTRVFISTSPPVITPIDICEMFVDKRIPKCRLDCFEATFADSSRKDMIHLNKKGLVFVKEKLCRAL